MTEVRVARAKVASDAQSSIPALVRASVLPEPHSWGKDPYVASVMELTVSTLSHALNEDLMVARLKRELMADQTSFLPDTLAGWTTKDAARIFAVSPDPKNKDDPTKLADLVRKNFQHLVGTSWRSTVSALTDAAAEPEAVKEALVWLGSFPVFADDPLQKKPALFLQRLFMQRYVTSSAVAKAIPFAIDRHIVRLSLRVGWVVVDPESSLAPKLQTRAHMSAKEDFSLRSAVKECLELFALKSGVLPPELNFILWQFGRSYCGRYEPGCLGAQRLLGRGSEYVASDGSHCILSAGCDAFCENKQLSVMDPVHRGGFY